MKKLQPDAHIIYVGERGGKFAELTDNHADIDETYSIFTGKLRRYHGELWLAKLVDIQTLFRNTRDMIYVLIGIVQAWRLLGKLRPDVVFLKGGFVGLPVGFAAAIRKVPFITHDSDALPGLSNRLVSRWAQLHATGLPTEFYSYPKEKARYVGVLVGENFKLVNTAAQKQYRQELHVPLDAKMLLITGGSLGAQRLNEAMVKLAPALLSKYPDLHIVHQVGKGNLDIYNNTAQLARLTVLEFMSGMQRYSGAADVVVTRAGANTLAELGVQGKACVVVPNPQLTGGHQLENAKYLLQHHAVLAVDEASFANQIGDLQRAIEHLLDYPAMRQELGQALHSLTKSDAVHELAALLLQSAKSS